MWFEIHASLYARRVKGQMQVSLEWTKRETYRDFPTTVTVLLKQMDQSCPTKSVTRVNGNAACFTTVNSFMMWPKCCPNFVSLRRLFHYSDCHYADFYCTLSWVLPEVDLALTPINTSVVVVSFYPCYISGSPNPVRRFWWNFNWW